MIGVIGCSHSHPRLTPSEQETLRQTQAIEAQLSKKAPRRPVACLDALGLGDSPSYCQNLATAITEPLMLGTFLNEEGFGSSLACVTHLVDLGKVNAVRFEGEYHDDHNFDGSAQGLSKLAAPFRLVEPLSRRIPVRGSIACEHALPGVQAAAGISALGRVCPHCGGINVPLLSRGGAVIRGSNECHGKELCGNASSLDGTDPETLNLTAWKAQRSAQDYVCVWSHVLNRKTGVNDHTPRKLRRRIPTVAELKELIRLSK